MSKESHSAVDSLVALIEEKRLEAVSVFIKTESDYERQKAREFCELCVSLETELDELHARIVRIERGF